MSPAKGYFHILDENGLPFGTEDEIIKLIYISKNDFDKLRRYKEMRYKNISCGHFRKRLNRFTAEIELEAGIEAVHVKNTGRLKELLVPGAKVILSRADNTDRKTAYDLIAVYKPELGLVNIDSQAPNHVVKEWLSEQDFMLIKPEHTYGSSRLDFYMERSGQRYLMEVKGCTLERDGEGYFPDAPTKRGIKHLHELIKAAEEGYKACIAFVIAMPRVRRVLPNIETSPEFGRALEEAEKAGVRILYLPCTVKEDEINIDAKRTLEINGKIW